MPENHIPGAGRLGFVAGLWTRTAWYTTASSAEARLGPFSLFGGYGQRGRQEGACRKGAYIFHICGGGSGQVFVFAYAGGTTRRCLGRDGLEAIAAQESAHMNQRYPYQLFLFFALPRALLHLPT